MPARRHVIVLATICSAAGLAGLLLLGPAVRVLMGYQPSATRLDEVGAPGVPLTEHVVLVVVSGIANAQLSATEDPWWFLQIRRQAGEGAYGTTRAVQPSGDAPTWVALLSGAGPARSGVIDAREPGPLPIPTLFDYAARAGLRSVVVAGPAAWQAREGLAVPDRVELAPSSASVGEVAAEVLRAREASLAVVLVDAGRSTALRPAERAARIDAQVATIAAALDPARDTLIVTGDHGLLPDGSSGGHEAEVLHVPLVLWGRAIVPTALGTVDQRDIAATIAALLGLPYPPFGGRPLFDALRLDAADRARELARLRATPIEAEQAAPLAWFVTSPWCWGAGGPLLLLGIAWLIGRLRSRLRFLLGPLAGLGGYLLLWCAIYFGFAGKTISLSAIYGDWSGNLIEAGLWSSLALGAVAVGVGILRAPIGAWAAARELGWTSVLVLATLTVFVLLYLLVAGWPADRLPGLVGWTALLLALAQAAGVGLATPPAMLLAAMVAEVAGRGR